FRSKCEACIAYLCYTSINANYIDYVINIILQLLPPSPPLSASSSSSLSDSTSTCNNSYTMMTVSADDMMVFVDTIAAIGRLVQGYRLAPYLPRIWPILLSVLDTFISMNNNNDNNNNNDKKGNVQADSNDNQQQQQEGGGGGHKSSDNTVDMSTMMCEDKSGPSSKAIVGEVVIRTGDDDD
ncbi:hypothetical protein FOZ63_020370, partial [Perkinsus olseni]